MNLTPVGVFVRGELRAVVLLPDSAMLYDAQAVAKQAGLVTAEDGGRWAVKCLLVLKRGDYSSLRVNDALGFVDGSRVAIR